MTAVIRSVPPATGTAAGTAVSTATASSSVVGSITDCAACGACVLNSAAPSRCPGILLSRLFAPYGSPTGQLWHIFRASGREGP